MAATKPKSTSKKLVGTDKIHVWKGDPAVDDIALCGIRVPSRGKLQAYMKKNAGIAPAAKRCKSCYSKR